MNLLIGGIVQQAQLWLCRDVDGTVTIENSTTRSACCNEHHEKNEPCCDDQLIVSGQLHLQMQPAPLSIPPVTACLFIEPLILFCFMPSPAPRLPDLVEHSGGSPPLLHLATVVLVV